VTQPTFPGRLACSHEVHRRLRRRPGPAPADGAVRRRPLAVAAVTSPRLARAGQVDALRGAARTTRLYALASLVVVLLGTAMIGLGDTGEAWEMSQLWVSASYALWILAVALTLGLVVPAQGQAVTALEEGRDAGGAAGRMAAGAGWRCWPGRSSWC
jgi:hypothetical protein